MNMFEEDGDMLYTDAVASLFRDETASPLEIIAWSKLYDVLEDACDSFEVVSDLIERIIMKNL